MHGVVSRAYLINRATACQAGHVCADSHISMEAMEYRQHELNCQDPSVRLEPHQLKTCRACLLVMQGTEIRDLYTRKPYGLGPLFNQLVC